MKTFIQNRLFNTDIVARLFASLFMTCIGGFGMTKTNSIPGQALLLQGAYLRYVFIGLIVLSCIIVIDVLVNSIAGDRWHLNFLRKNRDIIYMTGAVLSFAPGWYMSRLFGLGWFEGCLYLGAPILILWLTLCDVRAKREASLEVE